MRAFTGVKLAVSLLVVCVVAVFSAPAFAGTGWHVTSTAYPTNLSPGGDGAIELNVYNIGETPSSGPVTVTDVLPEGVTATAAGDIQAGFVEAIGEASLWNCSGIGTSVVTCVNNPENLPSIPYPYEGDGSDGSVEHMGLLVSVASGVTGTLENRVTVAGGGASEPSSVSEPIVFSSQPAGPGLQAGEVWFGNANGEVDTQAGSHPYEVGFGFHFNTDNSNGLKPAGGEVRNLEVRVPPGLVGNTTAAPQCTRGELDVGEGVDCPPGSQVGIDMVYRNAGLVGLPTHLTAIPVYNMVPPRGVAAQFAFDILGINTFLDSTVRSGGDYGITTRIDNIAQLQIEGDQIVFWGEPQNPSHDIERERVAGASSGAPFLTLGTACEGAQAQTYSANINYWENESTGQRTFYEDEQAGLPTGLTDCGSLAFGPSLSISPDTSDADTPAGLTGDVKADQSGLVSDGEREPSALREATVTLPEGFVLNPGRAAGLQACSLAQSGLRTGEAFGDEGPPDCPLASQVGTDEITTPLLPDKLEGAVYLLESQLPHPKLLISAYADGVNVKLEGDISLNETTGQLVTTFPQTPPVPFTDFKLEFTGGAQAALMTPAQCGVYTSSADFEPWASPFVEDVSDSSGFGVDSGTSGAPCPSSSLPFTPTLSAGATTDQAGGFTDFSMLLQRSDDQQRIDKLQFKAPEGLLGMLSKVPLCTNAQAESNTCPEASKIGHTVVESGAGPYPLVVPEPSQPPASIYLTESYGGAPFGLAIVVPLHAGPFVLPTQRVRAKIEVDPHTAQITVTTTPLPQVVEGVPTDLREVDAVVERPEFMFNPTNCAPMGFSGTAWGTPPPGAGGAESSAPISSHFQVGSCRSLTFDPDFTISTSAKTSRADGASLTAKIVYPPTPTGHNQASQQANIAKVKVDLPKQLPSRLTTLQKACTEKTFEANPADCPADSRVGQVKVITPVLPVPLEGPAYFVSHGGAKFPEVVFVLQGDGVTIYVNGETFISPAGITSDTIRAVPDAPFSSFELKFPQGPDSALAANGDLCTVKGGLKMPTSFTGQNGAEIHESTPISVTGCPRAVRHERKKPRRKKRKK